MTTHLAYFRLAKDYLECANLLSAASHSRQVELESDSPILATLAHAFELSVKAHLLEASLSLSEIERFGHNLEAAYRKLCELNRPQTESMKKAVATKWRKMIRSARDDHNSRLNKIGIFSTEGMREFGSLTNDEIGAGIPKLHDDIRWLSDRHNHRGSVFRYTKFGCDSRPHIRCVGLDIFTVERSILWATEALIVARA